MEISFSSVDNIQVVVISGVLGETEGAAVRFKLDEKIKLGRLKILFDLTNYDLANAASRRNLQFILSYALTRQTLIACSVSRAEHWQYLVLPQGQQVKIVLSKAEAI